MKRLLIILFLVLSCQFSYSQSVSDLGKRTYSEVKMSQSSYPCEETYNEILTYCAQGGHKISYMFKRGILNGIAVSTAHSTRYSAERELDKEVSGFQSRTGIVPLRSGGQTIFSTRYSPVSTAHGVQNVGGTYYYVQYHFLN